jgi:hypothetical protein
VLTPPLLPEGTKLGRMNDEKHGAGVTDARRLRKKTYPSHAQNHRDQGSAEEDEAQPVDVSELGENRTRSRRPQLREECHEEEDDCAQW